MNVYRIIGHNCEVKVQKSVIDPKWSSKGRFRLNGDAPTFDVYSGMHVGQLGQFNQIGNSKGTYEMYTLEQYLKRDLGRFIRLYQKREKVFINEPIFV